MLDIKSFIALVKNNMKPETIYIKEVSGLVVVFYKHYKENSMFIILREKEEIKIFRNENNILNFDISDIRKGIKILNDMLNAYAVYITINYRQEKTAEEIENESTKNTTKSSFDCLFQFKKDDIYMVLTRYILKKE